MKYNRSVVNTRSLRYVMIKHVVNILEECEGSRKKASEILETSKSNLMNLVREGKKNYGIEVREIKSNTIVSKEKASFQIFPTNKQRLKHLDRTSNKRYT